MSTVCNLYRIWAINLYVIVIVSYFLAEMFILMCMHVMIEMLDFLSKFKVTVKGQGLKYCYNFINWCHIFSSPESRNSDPFPSVVHPSEL